MEQGERDGDPSVESRGGHTDLAACCSAGSPRGAGVRHDGDAIQRQQAAGLPVASRTDRRLHEGNNQMAKLQYHNVKVSSMWWKKKLHEYE